MVGLSHSPNNDYRRDDFMKDVRELGWRSGLGKESLTKLGMKVVQAAADGVIGTDDIKEIYEEYTKSESKKRQHTEGGVTANRSKLNQLAKFGALGVSGVYNPVAWCEELATVRQKMVEEELKPKALYAAMVDMAREALGEPDDFDPGVATYRRVLSKDVKDDTELDVLKRQLKGLERTHNGGKDAQAFPSPELASAIKFVEQRIQTLLLAEKHQQLFAMAQELGYEANSIAEAVRAVQAEAA